jgi:hypothetical protein
MVPKVYLADPDVEPSDEDLRALSLAARDEARARYLAAERRFRAGIRAQLQASREIVARSEDWRPDS